MAIDFPSNRDQLVPPQPAGPIQDGDVYIYQGITYTAKILGTPPNDSVQWNAATSAGSDAYVLKVGDTMTGQLTLPGGGTGSEAATVDQITSAIPAALWQRDGGTSTLSPVTADDNIDQGAGDITTTGDVSAAAGTFTGDVSAANFTTTGDVQTASLNGGPLAGLRNQIINGNFRIQQRGSSFSAPADVYTADRWWMGNAAGRNVDFTSDGPYQNAIRITNNTADNVFLRQGIEIQEGKCGPFTLNSVWTLSLWSDSTAWVGRNLGVAAFRDAGKMNDSTGQAGVTATAFAATGETASGMSRYALQITIDASPAATHSMLCLGLSLPSGGHRISAVQFEPGPVATPYEQRPISLELSLAQRYFFKTESSNNGALMNGGCSSSNTATMTRDLPVTMRAVPTLAYRNLTLQPGNLNATPATDRSTPDRLIILWTANPLTVGNSYWIEAQTSQTGSISADAEL